jgi:hypothetical protein
LIVLIAGTNSSLPEAQAAESVSVILTPSAVSAGPGQNLTVTVSVTNSGSEDLPAGEAVVTAPSAAITTATDLDSWLATDIRDSLGRYLSAADIPEIAAGTTVDVPVELPLSLGRFGGVWGVRGLAVDYQLDGESSANARSSFVWTTGATPAKVGFTGILPVVPPPSTSGLLTADELTELTGPSGILTRQLDTARGRPVAVGIDPRILASIEMLGEKAPESVLSWFVALKSLTNESFLLSYADADLAAQAQAGAAGVISPSTADVIAAGEPEVLTATPVPSSTPTALPVAAFFSPTVKNIAWPAQNSVIASDLGIFTASGLTTVILSSANVTGTTMSSGVAAGIPAVVTLNGLSTALENNDVSRAASYLAVASVDDAQAGLAFASLPRETFSITELSQLGQALDSLMAQDWVGAGTLTAGLASATSVLEIVDSPESSQRISVVSNLLARNSAVSSFSTIAEEPSLITSPASRELAAVLSVGWLGNAEWSTAVSESLRSSEKILNSVTVVTSSTINMVGGQANIPISVHNSLLQPVTVVVSADPNNARLIVKGTEVVTVQPESQGKAPIPVQAQVSNGSAVLTISLSSQDGIPVGQPVSVPINVRADWESWGLVAVALAFVGLLTAGVIRTLRRRKQGQSEDV